MSGQGTIDNICSELSDLAGPRGLAGSPPIDGLDQVYEMYVVTYGLGATLWALVSTERQQPSAATLRRAFENRVDQSVVDLAWKARADIEWLIETADDGPASALWSRNWFVRVGLDLPAPLQLIPFAAWWARFAKSLLAYTTIYAGVIPEDPDARPDQLEVPRDSDLILARYELSEVWRQAAAEAAGEGAAYYVHPAVADAWRDFGGNPTIATAELLWQAMPTALDFFIRCAPGGMTYLLHRLGGKRALQQALTDSVSG
jgi:hypothetical protein